MEYYPDPTKVTTGGGSSNQPNGAITPTPPPNNPAPLIITQQSNSLANLSEALSKAQGSWDSPKKTIKVDFINNKGQRVAYKYADLADVMKAIQKPFLENGLSIVHQLGYRQFGNQWIYGMVTWLMHVSGERIDSFYPLPDPLKSDIRAQEFGSAQTYARRYSVSGIAGIAAEQDDDGSNASDSKKPPVDDQKNKNDQNQKQNQKQNSNQKTNDKKSDAKKTQSKKAPPANEAPASDDLIARMEALMLERAIQHEEIKNLIETGFQRKVTDRLPIGIAERIIKLLTPEDANAARVMAYAEQLKNHREAQKIVNTKGIEPGDHEILCLEKWGMRGKKVRQINEELLKRAIEWVREEREKGKIDKTLTDFEVNAVAWLKTMDVNV